MYNCFNLAVHLLLYYKSFMLNAYKTQIDQAISELIFPDQPADLYDPIRYMLTFGGKRVRPLLVLLSASLYGEEMIAKAMPAAVAIELFHNFTLMHDDIMDEAPLRRGKSTVHQKWNGAVAILAGDNMMVRSYQELSHCGPQLLPELLNELNQVAREVCEGQQWDMQFEKREMVSKDEYLSMIRLKTAVLLGTSLKMGAIIGGASSHDADCLYNFGISLGVAFQLQDDILDVYGDVEKIGKQSGGDILSNKKTILTVLAHGLADDSARQEFKSLVHTETSGDVRKEQDKISAVKGLYDRLAVFESANELQKDYIGQAFDSLDKMEIEQDRLDNLRKLAHSLLNRTN